MSNWSDPEILQIIIPFLQFHSIGTSARTCSSFREAWHSPSGQLGLSYFELVHGAVQTYRNWRSCRRRNRWALTSTWLNIDPFLSTESLGRVHTTCTAVQTLLEDGMDARSIGEPPPIRILYPEQISQELMLI